MTDSRIPVTVVTGFLGSGKTTLLRRVLSAGGVRNIAILVNEVAEVGIDQRLLGLGTDDVQLLENGCICCTVKEDLRKSLGGLLDRPADLAISHVIIETTGLADPVPILGTFMSDASLKFHFRVSAVVTVVDCVNAVAQLRQHRECTNQVAAADRIVLGKTDLASAETIAMTQAAVESLNPAVPIVSGAMSDADLAAELLQAPAAQHDEAARFCRLIAARMPAKRVFAEAEGSDNPVHGSAVTPFCIVVDGSFDWSAFALWLTMLLHAHGDRVLRVKGILNVEGSRTPVLINGVQRLMHRPEHLPAWPGADRRSILVFIVANLDPDAIRRSFNSLVR